jgi:hypothetical protein
MPPEACSDSKLNRPIHSIQKKLGPLQIEQSGLRPNWFKNQTVCVAYIMYLEVVMK